MEENEILYDHYKDTFEHQKLYLSKRDRYTVFLLIIATLLIGLIFSPDYINSKLNTLIKAQVDKLELDFQFINTGLILLFFWLLLQYYMVVLQIEKMYNYLNECETKLSELCNSIKINREGAYYLKSYPWMKTFADKLFVMGIPLGFIILSVAKIINEWDWTSAIKWVDIIFLVLTSIVSVLYLLNRLFHK